MQESWHTVDHEFIILHLWYVTGTTKAAEITLEEIFPNSANRKPNEATELLQLRDEHPEVVVVKELDITEYDKGFKEFVQDIKVV